MADEVVLETRKISKHFPGVLALQDVDFSLKKGEVHILLGENGAGKSTFVKLLGGVYQPTGGEILFSGKPIVFRTPRHSQQSGISIIYQELILIPELSAAENIFLGREAANKLGIIRKKEVISSAQKILGELGIEIDCSVPVKSFGIAQQQMIEIAKALSLNARIIIMDETTSALSLTETIQLFKIIRKLQEKGVSVIYISHKIEELFEIGDRVTVLRDGRLT
ncbi:MAG: ATP-binding cassette domain-containing protein, partial [Ignavibacteriales bacterium]